MSLKIKRLRYAYLAHVHDSYESPISIHAKVQTSFDWRHNDAIIADFAQLPIFSKNRSKWKFSSIPVWPHWNDVKEIELEITLGHFISDSRAIGENLQEELQAPPWLDEG